MSIAESVFWDIVSVWPLLVAGLVLGVYFIVRNEILINRKCKKLDQEIYRLKEINKNFKEKYQRYFLN